MQRLRIAIVAAGFLLAAPSAFATDTPTPPPISVGTCIERGDVVEQPAGSAIRACCLDGVAARGCYICDANWESCVWESAFTDRGKPGLDGVEQAEPLDAQIPDPPRIDVQPQPVETDGKQVDLASKKKLQVVKPLSVLSPIPLDCILGLGSGLATVNVRNSTNATIEEGRQIGWRTAQGDQGGLRVPFPLDPGKVLHVGGSQATMPGCSAWLVPLEPQLQQ